MLSPTARATASPEIVPAPSFSPSTPATVAGTRVGSDSDASSTNQPPSAKFADNARRAAFRREAGFADAAGSGQGHHTIGGHEVPQLRHRRRSANEACHGRGKVGHRGCTVDPHPLQTDRRLCRVVPPDSPVTEQAIAAARPGLQQSPIRTERLADRHRMNLQRVFRDNRAWPDAIHQLVFSDSLAGRPGENFDDLESAPADRHGRTEAPGVRGEQGRSRTRLRREPAECSRQACPPDAMWFLSPRSQVRRRHNDCVTIGQVTHAALWLRWRPAVNCARRAGAPGQSSSRNARAVRTSGVSKPSVKRS